MCILLTSPHLAPLHFGERYTITGSGAAMRLDMLITPTETKLLFSADLAAWLKIRLPRESTRMSFGFMTMPTLNGINRFSIRCSGYQSEKAQRSSMTLIETATLFSAVWAAPIL